jgi:uncharacterized protein with HEPN domain
LRPIRTIDAVERCLLRICEATSKLGDFAGVLMPNQPWARIRALGNFPRHEYDRVDQDEIWEIVETRLSPLIAACEDALRRLS